MNLTFSEETVVFLNLVDTLLWKNAFEEAGRAAREHDRALVTVGDVIGGLEVAFRRTLSEARQSAAAVVEGQEN